MLLVRVWGSGFGVQGLGFGKSMLSGAEADLTHAYSGSLSEAEGLVTGQGLGFEVWEVNAERSRS